MGIFNLFKKQFIDVIEWVEEENGVLSKRFSMADREIQNGAQLTVRNSQLALFVNEGQLADMFEPGMHTIATNNLPVLTNLKHWDKGFQSPFKTDLYFYSTRDQLDQRWGTPTPIVLRDKEFGPIRLRANGTYSYRIKNPKTFFSKVSGSKEIYTTTELEGQLRSIILTSLASHFGKIQVSFVDMAGNQLEFSEILKAAIAPSFESYGLELQSFFVQSISLPEELQSHLDKISSMKMVGDLKTYAQFQSADSISIAAKNEGGMGMGVGLAMGQNMMNNSSAASAATEDPMETIKKLHELLKVGAITQVEFDAKKSDLLGKIK
ncbi:MAG TPA: SPFH domain-containing protein [Bacteriovoracaceae bacterium]|nr:SPFH domain-containing protein [Bacteriovoracaceae bacterium]